MTDTPSLFLRRKRAVAPADAPPVEAFCERVPEDPSVPVAHSDGPAVAVVFQPPAHLHDPHPEPMDLDAFCIGKEGPQVAAVGLRNAGRVAVVAAMVPLTLLTPALATAAPPSLPEGKDGSVEQPEPKPEQTPPSATTTPSDEPSNPADDKNALWEALVGEDLILIKSDDSRVDGRLLGVQGGRLVISRTSDGLVVDVDPAGVTGIYSPTDQVGPDIEQPGQAAVDPELAQKPGTGLMIGGGVLLGLSGTFFVSAAILGLRSSGYYSYYSPASLVPLIVAGVLTAGGGVPMVVVGALRHKKLKKATTERRLRASVSPNLNGGWSTSLSLRF